MKNIIVGVLLVVLAVFGLKSYEPATVYFNRTGRITKQMRVWVDTVSASSGSPSIDISAAGFIFVTSVTPQVIQNTSTLTTFTWCNIKTYSTTSVTLNLAQENSGTVNILGSLVLLGVPLQSPSSTSGIFVSLRIEGY